MVELKGIDVEIFLEDLKKDITDDEIKSVREWVLDDKVKNIKLIKGERKK